MKTLKEFNQATFDRMQHRYDNMVPEEDPFQEIVSDAVDNAFNISPLSKTLIERKPEIVANLEKELNDYAERIVTRYKEADEDGPSFAHDSFRANVASTLKIDVMRF